jgi:aconitate hydratase
MKKVGNETVLYPDSLVGTDSHTTTINGLGVVGWGVGGIEAEAVMLGQPIYMLMPEVIGFKLVGKLRPDVTATDLVLTITQILRKKGVVGKFVEYFGSTLDQMGVADRAVLANMSPEYGATMGFFPIDKETLKFLRLTGKTEAEVELVERYTKEQGMFHSEDSLEPEYTEVLTLDLSTVEPSLAGPKRPQDRVSLSQMKESFKKALEAPVVERGFGLANEMLSVKKEVAMQGVRSEISHGAVVIASITSCTNTSDPDVMIGAGLLAKRALEKGLTVKPYVKTSLAPGSRAVTEYLKQAGLLESLEKLGFFNAGYGCMTCIGNSGPLPEPVAEAVTAGKLIAASVLSGNRNFEGRVHPQVKANYLASPALVVAYAIAGTVDFDFEKEPLGKDKNGKSIFLKEIWPLADEVAAIREKVFTPEAFQKCYTDVFEGTAEWKALEVPQGELYEWDAKSTYIQEPPFFKDFDSKGNEIQLIQGARCLAVFGDSITTDHISPAGSIKADGPAGKFLIENGVSKENFNSYGARRGNDRVMARGTFANIRLRNLLAPGTEGGVTKVLPEGNVTTIYDAAVHYKNKNIPLIILAGKEYGSGSSRDWAAKGPYLLGVRAVIAESYERIHRSNLVGMGILPLQFIPGHTREKLGLTGEETFTIKLTNDIKPLQEVTVSFEAPGKQGGFKVIVRIDTAVEVEYYRNGGILQTVLKKLLKGR